MEAFNNQTEDEIIYERLPNGKITKYKKSQQREWKKMIESYRNGTLKDPRKIAYLDQLLK